MAMKRLYRWIIPDDAFWNSADRRAVNLDYIRVLAAGSQMYADKFREMARRWR